ncbi:urea carboxylase [Krasilnikovia cinnamomea]|uniref:Urea carboxylase n=1 Tax=Krasilnikovia cinnamomea TaxID=349313 RepID=A0A4Q7ZR40_9ACTN|nr:5-oxoprolinase/urea amidolyase family protein [Krasilnikovia cinnamomea]RZU53597.1 urea carboxylase [Krasilnikovia cinnamomea]
MTGAFEILVPGIQTTVQDLPGRTGLWGVGVPPSGAWDDLSFGLANRAVGNPAGAAGLEAVLRGPKLRVLTDAVICVTGAATAATLDGVAVTPGHPTPVAAGQVLDLGPARGPGLRSYLAVRGGLSVPAALGSAATFLLGGFGGHEGRALAKGDILHAGTLVAAEPSEVLLPELTGDWQLRVVPGPHGAPEHLSEEGIAELFAAQWRVDHRADRTGVRLAGPSPRWARSDGGDAGLHPSNIHDSAYPVGGIMISGDTPVIVGPDGPSLGGFVVAAVVIRADRWKLAQARPGDRIRLVPVAPEDADAANEDHRARLAGQQPRPRPVTVRDGRRPAPLAELPADGDRPTLTVRRAGDHHALVEAGPAALDLAVRLRIHLLAGALAGDDRIVEAVEGVRSLLLAVDERRLPLPALAELVAAAWAGLPDPRTVELTAREVTMPIAFDDPSVHEAMARYQSGVRPDAPWCPDNVEFIRRINGLDRRGDVFDIVRSAAYLVVGLGDVYLGAPVAVPLDPRHRLVTTKYNPPRTWTPANAVGIGGVYLCVYGMEGPGGYQLVGRTVPVWRYDPDSTDPPWLLRQFDVLRFTPVTPQRLVELRADIASGRSTLETRPVTLRLADLLDTADAAAFTARRAEAFAAERDRWAAQALSADGPAGAGAFGERAQQQPVGAA